MTEPTPASTPSLPDVERIAKIRERMEREWGSADERFLLAEHDRLAAELARAQHDRRMLLDERNGDVWIWAGDGEDHPESLVCPVLMSAEQVRGIMAELAAKDAEIERLRKILADRNIVDDKYTEVSREALERKQ